MNLLRIPLSHLDEGEVNLTTEGRLYRAAYFTTAGSYISRSVSHLDEGEVYFAKRISRPQGAYLAKRISHSLFRDRREHISIIFPYFCPL